MSAGRSAQARSARAFLEFPDLARVGFTRAFRAYNRFHRAGFPLSSSVPICRGICDRPSADRALPGSSDGFRANALMGLAELEGHSLYRTGIVRHVPLSYAGQPPGHHSIRPALAVVPGSGSDGARHLDGGLIVSPAGTEISAPQIK